MLYLVAHLCATLCDPMNCSLLGSCAHGYSLVKNSGVSSLSLLQGMAQESNRGLLHCRQILYQLSYPGSQYNYIYILLNYNEW